MKTEWNLDVIYKGIEDPKFEEDFKKAKSCVKELEKMITEAKSATDDAWVEDVFVQMETFTELMESLYLYVELCQSVDTENGALMAQVNRIMKVLSEFSPLESAAMKLLATIDDVDTLANKSEVVKEYLHIIERAKEKAKYLLSDDAEEMIAAMSMTGSSAWSQLQAFLSSTVAVDYEGKEVTLSEIRNMAYSPDAKVRKLAYEAEIKSYEKIQDGIAFALNNIKNEVTMLSNKRGYESPLAMTLAGQYMSRETLDAMMEAISDYLPEFHRYLKKKAELLGHKNGLPFYDLFAPLGKADKTFTVEEAREYLVNCFKEFSSEMSDMMAEAFDNEWIDFFPRKGKQGGAFCAGVAGLKQSRILTNFDGYFGSVGTLAHELGHAFHNKQIQNERALNHDYSMPVAETASTFNETHLGRYALQSAEDEERLNLLENSLMEDTQVIVDIYSRYLFETAVFEQSKNKFLMANDLKELMLAAQKKAYGDGLDPEYLHPYMWACKSHYYSASQNFYNFPYAFGALFAKGLYKMFEKEGDAFVEKYKLMLQKTPACSIEETGAMMGIDLTKKEFWAESLSMVVEDINEFCKF